MVGSVNMRVPFESFLLSCLLLPLPPIIGIVACCLYCYDLCVVFFLFLLCLLLHVSCFFLLFFIFFLFYFSSSRSLFLCPCSSSSSPSPPCSSSSYSSSSSPSILPTELWCIELGLAGFPKGLQFFHVCERCPAPRPTRPPVPGLARTHEKNMFL